MGKGLPRDWTEGFDEDVSSSTLVHIRETTGKTTADGVTPATAQNSADYIPDCSYREQLFSRFPKLTKVTEQALSAFDVVYEAGYGKQLDDCRTITWVGLNRETRRVVYHANSCRLRWCPVCADVKAGQIARSCKEFFSKQKEVRFVTLTLKHRDEPVKVQLDRATKCLAALRRTVLWRKHVTGCIGFMQSKPIRGGDEWHNHFHMLLTGSYLPKRALIALWKKITGDSFIVDIQQIKGDDDLEKAVNDIVRYVGRPSHLLDVDLEHQAELIDAMRGRRLGITTGNCREKEGGISLRPPKRDVDEGNEERWGRIETFWELGRQGDAGARAAYRAELMAEPLDPKHNPGQQIRKMEGKFTGLSESSSERGPPKSSQMRFETDFGFGSDEKW